MQRIINLIIIFFGTALFSPVLANNNKAVPLTPEDSITRAEVVRIIREANVYNNKREYDEALRLYKIAKSLAESIDDLVLLASSAYNTGLTYYRKGDYIISRDYFINAIDLSQKASDSINMAQYQLLLGKLYKNQGDYNNATKLSLEALSFYERHDSLAFMAQGYTSMASIQNNLKNDSIAIHYYELAMNTYLKLENIEGLAIIHNNMGDFYMNRKVFDKSQYHLRTALAMKIKSDNNMSISTTLMNLGDLYYHTKNTDSAEYYYQDALHYATKAGNKLKISSINNSIAQLLINKKEFKSAIEYLSDSRKIALKNTVINNLLENYRLSSLAYAKTMNFEKAYSFSTLYIDLNNKKFDKEKNKGISELHFQYDTEKKDLTIKNLNDINNIKSKTLRIRNTSLIVISSVLFLSFILAIFLFRAYKAKRKALNQVQLLMREKQHRTKNNLQLLSSVLSLQSLKADDENKNMALAGEHRVQSIVLLDKLLSNESLGDQVEIKTYIQNLVEGLKEAYDHQNRINFELQIGAFLLAAPQATHLGLIINELITNSLKYAFNKQSKPSIQIICKKDEDNHCLLNIKDNGPGLSDGFNLTTTSSLGLKLVKTMSKQLKGKYAITSKNGFEFELRFKLKYQG